MISLQNYTDKAEGAVEVGGVSFCSQGLYSLIPTGDKNIKFHQDWY